MVLETYVWLSVTEPDFLGKMPFGQKWPKLVKSVAGILCKIVSLELVEVGVE